jgi:hypothetical protein
MSNKMTVRQRKNAPAPMDLALLCVVSCLSLACLDDRPLPIDHAAASPMGGAGTMGINPSGRAGSGGKGVTTAKGCHITALVGSGSSTSPGRYFCTLPGCHSTCVNAGCANDNSVGATGLDMTSADWPQKLLGTLPSNAPDGLSPSLCLGVNEPYLVKGTVPAQGLFLDKLRSNPPCGDQMPFTGVLQVSAEDLDCFQRWADALTTQ